MKTDYWGVAERKLRPYLSPTAVLYFLPLTI